VYINYGDVRKIHIETKIKIFWIFYSYFLLNENVLAVISFSLNMIFP